MDSKTERWVPSGDVDDRLVVQMPYTGCGQGIHMQSPREMRLIHERLRSGQVFFREARPRRTHLAALGSGGVPARSEGTPPSSAESAVGWRPFGWTPPGRATAAGSWTFGGDGVLGTWVWRWRPRAKQGDATVERGVGRRMASIPMDAIRAADGGGELGFRLGGRRRPRAKRGDAAVEREAAGRFPSIRMDGKRPGAD